MRTKNSLAIMSAMFIGSLIDSQHLDKSIKIENDVENDYLIKPKKIVPKGLKEFKFPDTVIYAINQKNAEKKYKKFLKTKRLL